MTRSDLIVGALKIVGDTNLVSEARNWLDNVLYEIETMGYWRFLEKEITYQTEIGINNKTFTSILLTDYSKGLSVRSSEGRLLIQTSKAGLDEMNDAAVGFPHFFSIWADKLWLYPTPTTGKIPILTLKYFREMTVPTSDADDMELTTGIKPKWQRFLIDGIISEGFAYQDDQRSGNYRQLFDRHMMIMRRDNEDFSSIKESTFDKSSLIRREQQPQQG